MYVINLGVFYGSYIKERLTGVSSRARMTATTALSPQSPASYPLTSVIPAFLAK